MPSFSSPSGTKLPHKKLETRLSYGGDPESLSHLGLGVPAPLDRSLCDFLSVSVLAVMSLSVSYLVLSFNCTTLKDLASILTFPEVQQTTVYHLQVGLNNIV